LLLAAVRNLDAHQQALCNKLLRHSKRTEDHYRMACMLKNGICPGDRHPHFSESGISENRRLSTAQRPFGDVALVREQGVITQWRINACAGNGAEFVGNKIGVIHPNPRWQFFAEFRLAFRSKTF
jgi:hypothetical protein